MSDIQSGNPFVKFGKTAPVGDEPKRKPAETAAEARPAAEPYTPATDHKDPKAIFGAMAAQAQGAQGQIVQNRIETSLKGLPSPEAMARFGALVEEEFPGISDINAALIASGVAVDQLLGVPTIRP